MDNTIKLNTKALNLSEIARKCGLSRSYVGALLTGERKNKEALERVMNAIKGQVAIAD